MPDVAAVEHDVGTAVEAAAAVGSAADDEAVVVVVVVLIDGVLAIGCLPSGKRLCTMDKRL